MDGSNSKDNSQTYPENTESISASSNAIALIDLLSEEQKKWYLERGQLLVSKKIFSNAQDVGALTNGFPFDIPDDLQYLSFMTRSIFPGVSGDLDIPETLIKAGSQRAFISACLIELMLFMHSKNVQIISGFGTHRATNFEQAGSNNSKVQSGTVDKKTYVTDHAFGRAIDIFHFSIIPSTGEKPAQTLISASVAEYTKQLEDLLQVLNTAPAHLLPDRITVGTMCPSEYITDSKDGTVNKVLEKYPNLRYVRIQQDAAGVTVHNSHIHISFSSLRSGIYSGPNGSISLSGVPSNADSGTGSSGSGWSGGVPVSPILPSNNLDKSYVNQKDASLLGIEVYELLNSYGNFSPEISAMFTAIAYRESAYKPTAVNQYGFFGLWQMGTRTNSGGLLSVQLTKPSSEKILFWRLAYKDWNKEELTERNIDSKLKEVQTVAPNYGFEYYDERIWIPINQVMALRAKISQTDLKKQVSDWGSNVSTSLGSPWGDTYLPNGFIAGLSFKIAADVYVQATGKSSDVLKEWVLDSVPKDSRTRNKDTKYGIPKLEVWVDLSKYTSSILSTYKKSPYKQLTEGLLDGA